MRSLPFAVMFLLLRIAYGSTEEADELRSSASPPIADCHSAPGECIQEECLQQLRSRFTDLSRKEIKGNQRISDCLEAIATLSDGSYRNETPRKRGSITKNSFFFMKLHPVLNRAVDANLIKVPNRYRRIGVRLGSEFLGKRSERGDEKEEEVRRGRSLPGNEFLGKRYGSEMLGKRNVEMLGKRGVEFLGKRGTEFLGKRGTEFLGKRGTEFLGKRGTEFLGKRGTEFLGKRGTEFLGKRGTEFLGKRGTEFLGKRGTEFLGKRGTEFLGKRSQEKNGLRVWICRDGEDCYVKWSLSDPRIILQYLKVTAGAEVDGPEDGYHGRSNPDRFQPSQLSQNPAYYLEKL